MSLTKKRENRGYTKEHVTAKKYYGDEPQFVSSSLVLTKLERIKLYTYYNALYDVKDAKEFLITFCKNMNVKQEVINAIDSYNEEYFPLYMGWLARIRSRGGKVDDAVKEKFKNKLIEMYKSHVSQKEVKRESRASQNLPSVHDRVNAKVDAIITEIQDMSVDANYLDEKEFYEYLKKNEVPVKGTKKIQEYLDQAYEEIHLAHSHRTIGGNNFTEKEQDVIYSYRIYSKQEIKDKMLFLIRARNALSNYTNGEKVKKEPRKVKIDSSKLIKNLNYQKESAEYMCSSVNPLSIIGSDQVWLFNTKYKTMTCIVAAKDQTLTVSGTTIKNYDPELSKSFKVGKDAKEQIKFILESNKVQLRSYRAEKQAIAFSSRVGENTIILKVHK